MFIKVIFCRQDTVHYTLEYRDYEHNRQIIELDAPQLHGVYLHLLTKLSQSRHVVYHVQPIVMAYTPQNLA